MGYVASTAPNSFDTKLASWKAKFSLSGKHLSKKDCRSRNVLKILLFPRAKSERKYFSPATVTQALSPKPEPRAGWMKEVYGALNQLIQGIQRKGEHLSTSQKTAGL